MLRGDAAGREPEGPQTWGDRGGAPMGAFLGKKGSSGVGFSTFLVVI